ncbi:MAG TPA: tetratricopeptide repeat protein, partial [bacterium]|nr:tetratricopeptide repeat protein [bacterium]
MVAPVRIPSILLLWIFLAYPAIAVPAEAESPAPGDHDQQIRERYEQVLRENPYQERAFDKAYEMYVTGGGIEAWMEKLNAESQNGSDQNEAASVSALVVLARIHQRHFDTAQALACLEQAAARGEKNPQLQLLLGKLYYEAGEDDNALEALQASLETIPDEEKRNPLIRMLGHIYLRRGQPQEPSTIAAWRRIVEGSADNHYSLQELAEIYRDNRMWNEAIEVFRRIADMPAADAYRRCRALQAIGQCYLPEENFPEA